MKMTFRLRGSEVLSSMIRAEVNLILTAIGAVLDETGHCILIPEVNVKDNTVLFVK
jgi:hypothetical protein